MKITETCHDFIHEPHAHGKPPFILLATARVLTIELFRRPDMPVISVILSITYCNIVYARSTTCCVAKDERCVLSPVVDI